MANARKRKARKARRAVNRGDRVKATPETLAKLQPHPLEVLLSRGRDDGGIDADQLQCAEEVVDAFSAVTRGLGVKAAMLERIGSAGHLEELSSRDERLSVIWFAWAAELPRRLLPRPVVVVEMIGGVRPASSDDIRSLGRALDLWAQVRQDTAQPVRELSTIRPNGLDNDLHALTGSGR
jgi:hypothetical protein